ncbi:peptidase [Streptomyces sp. NPDC006711]|uniref:peptidase n=1 Tax=unclassified Streptomyces TaxID=2593676 RepID=UPI0033F340C2
MPYPKRTALALAAAVAGSVVLVTAPVAQASVVDVNYDCKTPIGAKSAVSPIDIKAVQNGGSYQVTMSFQKGVSSSPVALGPGAMNPSATITLGGADKGAVAVSGPANSAEIPANSPIKISDLSGTYVPKANGKVTFTAGVLTIKALGTTTTCTASNSPGPSLELDVTGATGATGATGSGGTPGPSALPKTGPLDSAVALGTLGATVVLVGAAGVLWLTRRGRRV